MCYIFHNKQTQGKQFQFLRQKVLDFTGKFRSIVTKYTKYDPRQIAT